VCRGPGNAFVLPFSPEAKATSCDNITRVRSHAAPGQIFVGQFSTSVGIVSAVSILHNMMHMNMYIKCPYRLIKLDCTLIRLLPLLAPWLSAWVDQPHIASKPELTR
jgi:hypothetical protein